MIGIKKDDTTANLYKLMYTQDSSSWMAGNYYEPRSMEDNGPNASKKGKAVPLHAMEAFGGRGDIAPTHS
jgi:hypothetical protein